jgi:RNA binding exosome subunit
MLDKIKSLFKPEYQFSHMSALVGYIGNVISVLSENYTKDKDSKNAAIDAICELLQAHKDQPEQSSEAQNG